MCGDFIMRRKDKSTILFENKEYEILTADNSENSENLGSSLIINYRPMPLISLMMEMIYDLYHK